MADTFKVTDHGELVDSKYHQHEASAFMSTLVGRQEIISKSKPSFTARDVVREGFLMKRGSWFKSWKNRFFILRRDIKELCIYQNSEKDSLTMVGSVCLDATTRITVHEAKDGIAAYPGGYPHEIHISTGRSAESELHLQAPDELLFHLWLEDITKEAREAEIEGDDVDIWWSTVYETARHYECLSKTLEILKSCTFDIRTHSKSISEHSKGWMVEHRKGYTGALTVAEQESGALHVEHVHTCADDILLESDDEDVGDEEVEELLKMRMTIDAGSAMPKKAVARKAKKERDRLREEPPFEQPLIDRFTFKLSDGSANALGGLQVSVRFENILEPGDKVCVVFFGTIRPEIWSDREPLRVDTEWHELCRTEVLDVGMTESTHAIIPEVSQYFSLLQLPLGNIVFDHNINLVKITVFKISRENVWDGLKVRFDLAPHTPLGRCIITREALQSDCLLTIQMVPDAVAFRSITPSSSKPSMLVGIIGVNSALLFHLRDQGFPAPVRARHSGKILPYAETAYVFRASNNLQLLCMEQLFASRYSLSCGEALLSMLAVERNTKLKAEKVALKAKLETLNSTLGGVQSSAQIPGLVDSLLSGNIDGAEGKVFATITTADALIKAYQVYEDVQESSKATMKRTISHSRTRLTEACSSAAEPFKVVLPACYGGQVLRRSVWKKESDWQYCSMNLNIQILTGDILRGGVAGAESQSSSADVVCVPTITFGCAASHELKYHDGGLRRTFSTITDPIKRLEWICEIQMSGGSLDLIKLKIRKDPASVAALFPFLTKPGRTIPEAKQIEEQMKLQQKVYYLSKRIDQVTSQILGTAVTSARTILHLANVHGTRSKMFQILARSLKIGFLVYAQCFLSTQGQELGMIEDLDIAILWLNRVNVHFVRVQTTSVDSERKLSDGPHLDVSYTPGRSEGVNIWRKLDGNLVVDIEVSDTEEATIRDALGEYSEYQGLQRPDSDYSTKATIDSEVDDEKIIATSKFVGCMFTQGVNEMQSMANMTRSSDVLRQNEINVENFEILKLYLTHYRKANKFSTIQAPSKASATSSTSISSTSDTVFSSRRQGQVLKIDRMLVEAREAIARAAASPYEKNVSVLLATAKIARETGGVICILCKSGKDRTSMGVTLEQARYISEEAGVIDGFEACQLMRKHGVRRMNVYANTGQSCYAFNNIQASLLPKCFRPPVGTNSGSVNS